MFCALTRHYNNTDHIILQISSSNLDKLSMTKNNKEIAIPNCGYSFVISGGFEPGVYCITSHNQYVEFFIMQNSKELESGTIDGTLIIEIDRYRYNIL